MDDRLTEGELLEHVDDKIADTTDELILLDYVFRSGDVTGEEYELKCSALKRRLAVWASVKYYMTL